MQLYINPKKGVPAWRQIVQQVKNLAAAGALEPGEKLPSVRALAKEIGVNPITTARAYRELEAEGVIETRQGAGTFLASRRILLTEEEALRRILPLVDEALVNSRQMGMTCEALIKLIRERNSEVFKDKEEE